RSIRIAQLTRKKPNILRNALLQLSPVPALRSACCVGSATGFWRNVVRAGTLERSNTEKGGLAMDWNRVEGNWKEVKGKVKEKWGKLTDDDLTAINGQRDQLEGRLQERYGYAKDQTR